MEAQDFCLDSLFQDDCSCENENLDESMEVEVTRGRLNSATISSIGFTSPSMPSLTRADPSSFRLFTG